MKCLITILAFALVGCSGQEEPREPTPEEKEFLAEVAGKYSLSEEDALRAGEEVCDNLDNESWDAGTELYYVGDDELDRLDLAFWASVTGICRDN